jgi:hypothetical protein
MRFGRILLSVVFLVCASATASADTVRVIVERALVWTQPSGISIVMSQLLKDQTAEVVRRVGDWYEIVAPPGSGGGDRRTGFISASQVVLEAGGSATTPPRTQTPRAPTARAQGRRQAHPRVLHLDAAYRVGGDDLTRTFTAFKDVFAEEGSIATNYGNRSGPAFDVLFAQSIHGSIGVGVGADFYVKKPHAIVEAHVPHPFYFNQLRTATFEADGLSGHEVAIHISGVWMPAAAGPLNILVFGGPTIFSISQTVVTDVVLDDQYPYDTVTIRGVDTDNRKGTRFGYHVGGDVSYYLTPSVGIGAGARYSRATLEFNDDDGVDTDGVAGALQATFGIRLRF